MKVAAQLARVTATLPASLVEAADRLAVRLGASRSAVLSEALRAYLGSQSARPGSAAAVAETRVAPYASEDAACVAAAGDGALLAELARRLARRTDDGSTPAETAPGGPRIRVDHASLAELCRRHHIRRLSFFGSVMRDDFDPASDVDVLVEFEPGQTIGFDVITIEEELSVLFGGRRVDLVIEKYLNPRLRERVLASAEVQYAA
jgi:predicted nucleotidyltransferase